MCFVFGCFAYMCFCARHACSARGGQERAPDLWNSWVQKLNPGPPIEQQVPLSTESCLQPVFCLFVLFFVFCCCCCFEVRSHCMALLVTLLSAGMADMHYRACSLDCLVLVFKDMILHWKQKKVFSYFNFFPGKNTLCLICKMELCVCLKQCGLCNGCQVEPGVGGCILLPNVALLCWGG